MEETLLIEPTLSDVIMALASVDDNGDVIPGIINKYYYDKKKNSVYSVRKYESFRSFLLYAVHI